MSEKTPQWIDQAVMDARRLFGMGGADWHFYVKVTDKPGGDVEQAGQINCDSIYQTANIELNNDLPNDQYGISTIYHEVLHAAHESVDHLVQEIIIEEVTEAKQELLKNLYRDAVENFVQRIARSIVENIEKQDRVGLKPAPTGGGDVDQQ